MLSVLVRFHDVARLVELERCLLSLACQSFAPTEVRIVGQRLSAAALGKVRACIDGIRAVCPGFAAEILNYTLPEPVDARSALLNVGLARAPGRYLAFLDYDDVIYTDAYETLIGELRNTNYAIAFAGVALKMAEVFDDAVMVKNKLSLYRDGALIDLFRANHCPIHSYVIDRERIDPQDLYFAQNMAHGEDYDFLLRLCARYPTSFAHKGRMLADYFHKEDGSNTLLTAWTQSFERQDAWQDAEDYLERQRRQLRLSNAVQRDIGLDPYDETLTVRGFLERSCEQADARQ